MTDHFSKDGSKYGGNIFPKNSCSGIKMKKNILRSILATALIFFFSCTSNRSIKDKTIEGSAPPLSKVPASAVQGTPFGPAQEFVGSHYNEIGKSGLFDVHPAETCRIAVLPNGNDSFAARIQALENADTSVRIQALIFTGDESGLYIAELLKTKKGPGAGCSGHRRWHVQPGPANAVDVF